MVKLSKSKCVGCGNKSNGSGNGGSKGCGSGPLIGAAKAGCPPAQSSFSRARCSQGLRGPKGPKGKQGATGIGNTWYVNDECDTPNNAKRDPICGDLLLNTSNCEICMYGPTGWYATGEFLNCASDCDSLLECLMDLPRPTDSCVFTLQLASCDPLFGQLGGVSVTQIVINDQNQSVPVGTFITPADLAALLQPLGWQWVPAGQTNLYINQFAVTGDPTAMGVDNSFTFSYLNTKKDLTVQCKSDQCDPCQDIIDGGEVLMLKDGDLQWVNAECFCPTGKSCGCESVLDCICNEIDTPEVSCEYCGYLDPDCFDFLNPITKMYEVATTTMDGTIVSSLEEFDDFSSYLVALNAINIIRIGDTLLKVTSSPAPIKFITFYETGFPIANVPLSEFNCCPTGIDMNTKVLSKLEGDRLAWVNADCLVKNDINLSEKICGLPQCQEYKCTILFDVCEPFNKNNLNFPWEFVKFRILGADQAHYLGKNINSPQDVFDLLETDPINDWTPLCPTGSCVYQLCVFSDTPVPDEESCYSLQDSINHIFINKDMGVDCHEFEDQEFQLIVKGSRDGVFLCDADGIVKGGLMDIPQMTGGTCGQILPDENQLLVLVQGNTGCYWIPSPCVGSGDSGRCFCNCDQCGSGNGCTGGPCGPCNLDGIEDCESSPKFDIKIVVKKDLIDIINCHFSHNQPYWIANYKLADGGTIDVCQPIEEDFSLRTLAEAFEALGWVVVPKSCNVYSSTEEICVFKDNSCDEIVSVCINILGNKGEGLPISFSIPVFCLTNVGCTGLFEDCKVLIRGPEPGDYCFVDKQCLMPTPQINLPKELCKLGECDSDVLYKVCLCLDTCDIERLITVFGLNAVLKLLRYELVGGETKEINRALPDASLCDLVDALVAEGWGISSGSVENPPVKLEICGPCNIQYVAVHDNSSELVAPYPVLFGVTCTVFKNCESQNPENMILVKKPDNEICWTPICPGGDGEQGPVVPGQGQFIFDQRNGQAAAATLGGVVRLNYPKCVGDIQAEVSHLLTDAHEFATRTSHADDDVGPDMTTDNQGNYLVTFENIDEGEGVINLINFDGQTGVSVTQSGNSIVVAKANQRGNWLWLATIVNQFGDDSNIFLPRISTDKDNNTYVAFRNRNNQSVDDLQFRNSDGSVFAQAFDSSRNYFVAKIDSDGTWQWDGAASANVIETTDVGGNDISVDLKNTYINVASVTDNDTLEFFHASNVTSTADLEMDGPGDPFDIFVASLNSDGEWRWRARAGDNSAVNDQPRIDTDCDGNVYLVGQCLDTDSITFLNDPDLVEVQDNIDYDLLHTDGTHVFWARIGQNGVWESVNSLSEFFEDESAIFNPSVSVGCNNNSFLVGEFSNQQIAFESGDAGTDNVFIFHNGLTDPAEAGILDNTDVFVAMQRWDFRDSSDEETSRFQGVWGAKIGGDSDESMADVAVSHNGRAFVACVSTSDFVRFYNQNDIVSSFFLDNQSTLGSNYTTVVGEISEFGSWVGAPLQITNCTHPRLAFDCDDNLFITGIIQEDAGARFINSDNSTAFTLPSDTVERTYTVKIARDQDAQTLGFLTSLPDGDNLVTAEFPGKQISLPGQTLVPAQNYYLNGNLVTSDCSCNARFMGTALSVRQIFAHSGQFRCKK